MPGPKDNWDKASIIGQILSGLLLAAIALFIKTGADNIATSLKKGDLVRSMISDLADSDKAIRQDLALIALDHSLGDQEQGMIVEIAEQIIRQGKYDNVTGTIAYKIISHRAPAKAKEIQDQAKLFAGNKTVREDLRSSANPMALVAATPTPSPGVDSGKQVLAKVLPNLILIQFKNEQSRATAEALRSALSAQGYFAPGVDQVDGNYSSSVRFFHQEDQTLAEQINELVKKFLNGKNINITTDMLDLSKLRRAGQPGQIEIWIDF